MLPRQAAATRILFAFTFLAASLLGKEASIVEREGRVVVTKAGGRPAPAAVGMGLVARDKLGTGEASRAVLRMSERWFARVDEETDIEINPGVFGAKDRDSLKIALGGAFIFSREAEGGLKVQTPSATGGLRGTQLLVRVAPDGKTWMQVLEGEVDLANELGQVQLRSGEAGEAAPGQPPRKTAALDARNLLQWTLYYPAVLPVEELTLSEPEQRSLADSLTAYRQGDLPQALAALPAAQPSESPALRLYRAAVVLATGRVDRTREYLQSVPPDHPGRRALERMLAAVLGPPPPPAGPLTSASLALAESFAQQAAHNLPAALTAARRATELAPQSGFTWARVAELEFSFGRLRETTIALDRALTLAPRHAQAHALRGFLLSADHRLTEAQAAFHRAIEIDGALGHAWLGLGLTKIRQNQLEAGRADLQTAAVMEPTRSFYYSYHAKALAQSGLPELARKDLALARQLDPADPTPPLYAALQDQQENRTHSALAELQQSMRLNDNRRVYRSGFLLDQDRAVRRANLAKIYQLNGLDDVALREAARAVESDYGSASAHQFLANSFDALRDPSRQVLRYETAWFNEQLLATLLSPVGGGALSQFVSQQEYSKLFEADRTGGSAVAEWRSDGQRNAQLSLFSTAGRLQLGVDLAHFRQSGTRPNHDTERTDGFLQAKYQVSSDDVVYALGHWNRQTGGDLSENFAHTPANAGVRFTDRQHPGLLLLGWNRTWAPGVHTLFLGGRLAARQSQSTPRGAMNLLGRDLAFLAPGFLRVGASGALEYSSPALRSGPTPALALGPQGALVFSPEFTREIRPFLGPAPVVAFYNAEPFSFTTERDITIDTAELQHLWRIGRTTLLAGLRWQGGEFHTRETLELLNPALRPFFAQPAGQQDVTTDFERRTGYAYAFSDPMPWLRLVAGASWDRIRRPENFRRPPISDGEETAERANGKFGFTLSPTRTLALRGVYTEALGGVTYDESVRLEPVQLAGFNQAFRTVLSESVAGSVETPIYKQWGVSVDGTLADRTWWQAGTSVLRESVRRTTGVFDAFSAPIFPTGAVILPSGLRETLDYREETSAVSLHHLLGGGGAVGTNLQRTRSELRRGFPQVPLALSRVADQRDEATLDLAQFHALWNDPSGWFARTDARWISQSRASGAGGGGLATLPGDRFWHFDVQAGVRFRRNLCEFSVAVLNLTGRDYRLSPITPLRTLPRERTAVLRLRISY